MKIRAAKKIVFGVMSAGWPALAWASDPTPLFVLFIGLPALVFSIGLAILAYKAPKLAFACSVVFLIAHIPVMNWAFRVRYMDDAGIWLYLSCAVGVFALLASVYKLTAPKA